MSETILVADQNSQFLDQTRYLLEGQGYTFLQANNGEEAKLKLELDPVDILLANVNLPSISGPALAQFIRYDLQRPIPVALMVGQGGIFPTQEELQLADSLLMRPLRAKELFGCVQSLFTIRNLIMQNQELRRRIDGGGGAPYESQQAMPAAAPPLPQPQAPPPAAPEPKKTLADEDPDSPLYPMSWFRKLAALEVKRAIRFHHPLSLLLLSYDFTEEYLEMHDEETIAHLSERLAHACRKVIRDIDIPVQFSRDHILMLLPNTGIEGAIQGASRIKNAIMDVLRAEIAAELGPPTLSIGATTSSTQGTFKFTDLLRDATRALREVRSQGGDGVFYC